MVDEACFALIFRHENHPLQPAPCLGSLSLNPKPQKPKQPCFKPNSPTLGSLCRPKTTPGTASNTNLGCRVVGFWVLGALHLKPLNRVGGDPHLQNLIILLLRKVRKQGGHITDIVCMPRSKIGHMYTYLRASNTDIHTYIHAYIHTYLPKYIHIYR